MELNIDENKVMDECLKFKNINEQLSGKKIVKTILEDYSNLN